MPIHCERRRAAPAILVVLAAASAVGAVAIAAPPPPSGAPAPSASVSASASPAPSSTVPYELTRPPRPPLPVRPAKAPVPWLDQIEIGGDAVWAARTRSSSDTSGVRYLPALGYGLHARWDMLSFLRFSVYFVDARHAIELAPNALGICPINRNVPCRENRIVIPPVHTFVFGARFQPIVRITPRVSAWASAGIGWGRMEFDRMQIFEVGQTLGSYDLPARTDPFVEFPLGFGVGFDLVPRWLAVEYEFNGAFLSDQGGEAVGASQATNREGHLVSVAGFPPFASSFTQTLGLSLKL